MKIFLKTPDSPFYVEWISDILSNLKEKQLFIWFVATQVLHILGSQVAQKKIEKCPTTSNV